MEAILFDLDGTLADMEVRLVNPFKQSLVEILGHEPDQKAIEGPLRSIMTVVGRKSRIKVVRIVWDIGNTVGMGFFTKINFMRKTLRNYRASRYKFSFIDGAEENLRFALENFKVGIVTSASQRAVEHAKRQMPLLNEVEVIITDDDVTNPKPDPEPIHMACEKLGVSAENAIYIGDLSTDIISSKNAGTISVAYMGVYGEYTRPLIEDIGSDVIVETQSDLLRYLKELKGSDGQ